MGTRKEIEKAVKELSKYFTFVYDENPRLRKSTPGIDTRPNPDLIADLFQVFTHEDYSKLMKGEDLDEI